MSPASGTAALMLYVSLLFMSEKLLETDHFGISVTKHVASASYNDLEEATNLSRSMISQGLTRLINLKLINRVGSHQQRRYELAWSEGGWFKLPCQAIVSSGVILPFKNFTMRSRHELDALKIYLYLAARRPNHKPFSMASYETISESVKVTERHIRKALVTLSLCGLLVDIRRNHEDEEKVYGPNMYYLTGHRHLFKGVTTVYPDSAENNIGPSGYTVHLIDMPLNYK